MTNTNYDFYNLHTIAHCLYPRQTGRRPYGDQKMYKVAGKREHNQRKSLKKLQLLDKAAFFLRSYCDLCDHTTLSRRTHHDLSAHMAFLLRYMGSATAITGDPAALSPRSWGSYHASSTCIASARRPQGVSTTFSRRLSEISRGSLCSHTAQ